MTVLEEIAHIFPTLGPDEQRQVLDVATRLRDARQVPDITMPAGDADAAAWDAWREGLRARSTLVLSEEKQRLAALALIDEHWNPLTNELPGDMLPSSKTSVET
jgi:hypothetical protein